MRSGVRDAPLEMMTALVSMATGRQVRSDVGMTGLNGRGAAHRRVKQKLLAAQRAGLSLVFIPQRNAPDLDDFPAELVDALDVKPLADVADIVGQASEPTPKTVTVAAYPAANVT
jgi:ATP-dependent Lon protease